MRTCCLLARPFLTLPPSLALSLSPLPPRSYLAHYDLVASRAGRARLYGAGMNPYLVRLSVGADDGPGALERALRPALARAAQEAARQREGADGGDGDGDSDGDGDGGSAN